MKSPLRRGRPTSRQSNSAPTRRIEMAAMFSLRSSVRSCGKGGRKTPLRIPVWKTAWRYVRRSWWPAKRRLVSCRLASDPVSGQMPLAPAARTNKLGEFLFLYVGRKLKSFPSFKCKDFVKHVRVLWITLYNACSSHVTVRFPVLSP